MWNGLPSDVTSASSLSVFKNRLKIYLFRRCYETDFQLHSPFLVIISHPRTVVLAIVFTVYATLKMSVMMMKLILVFFRRSTREEMKQTSVPTVGTQAGVSPL